MRESFERAKAKHHHMTVPELRAHLKKRKAEKRAFKAELRKKEQQERQKFEKWKIKRKYREKRKQAKSGKSTGALGFLETLGGSSKGKQDYDPFGLFPKRKSTRKTRKRKTARRPARKKRGRRR